MRVVKKLLTFVALSMLFLPSVGFAHTTRTDGDMSVLMHMTPDDDPIARSVTNIYFLFTDAKNKFTFQNCDCKVTILQNGYTLSEQKILKSFISLTFPKKAVYILHVTGKSLDGSFPDFSVSFDQRVERENEGQLLSIAKTYYIPFMLGSIIVVLSIVLYISIRRRKFSTK